MNNIAYITSQYPEFHETFVGREVEAIRKRGICINIYSLKTPGLEERRLYLDHISFVHYSAFIFNYDLIKANLAEITKNTGRWFKAIGWMLRAHKNQPVELLKALIVFPKTVYFASRIKLSNAIVHAHWATIPTSMAVVIKILTGRNFSFTAHAWDIFLSPQNLLHEKIGYSNGVVTCTSYNVTYLRSLCSKENRRKIVRNYHGLDFYKFKDLKKKRVIENSILKIIAVGRLVEQKGFEYLIRALKNPILKDTRLCLNIIGDGPLREELQLLCESLPENVEITLLGKLAHKETLNLMSYSDVLVAPSVIASDGDRDGIPNVILEAMACCLPVIATDVSGIPEVVRNGETGYLIAQADASEIASALLNLNDSYALRINMGAAGRQLVENIFDIDRNIEEFICLLDKFHN